MQVVIVHYKITEPMTGNSNSESDACTDPGRRKIVIIANTIVIVIGEIIIALSIADIATTTTTAAAAGMVSPSNGPRREAEHCTINQIPS